jgi:diaminopimelate epimerase
VQVDLPGGRLSIAWPLSRGLDAPVRMTGPATSVFEGVIEVPDL